MRVFLTTLFVGAMLLCAWLYYTTEPSGTPVDVRTAYALGLYGFCAAALIALIALRRR
jgi:hypothetical protein